MKAFLFGIIFLILVAAGAYVGLKYFYKSDASSYKTAPITRQGLLEKSNVPGSNFTHVLIATGESVGVASYSLNLDDYIGQTVSVTGQYSGSTLYADSISVIP